MCPEDNSLTLVYCDSDTARFVRYLNARAKPIISGSETEKTNSADPPFAYDVFVSYFDPLPNSDEGDEDDADHDDGDDEDDEFSSYDDDLEGEEDENDLIEGNEQFE